MCAPFSDSPLVRLPRPVLACVGAVLLVSLASSGCTPDSSGSPSPSDTTTTTVETSAPSPRTSSAKASSASRSAPTDPDASRTVAQRLADATVKARIKQALVYERALRPFNFSPKVIRGTVTLRGDVDTREQYRHAERVVESLEGVESVSNQVTVAGRPIPESDSPSVSDAASGDVYHTVQRGETLWQIAQEYDVSVRHLRTLNDLSSSLQAGERIRVQ